MKKRIKETFNRSNGWKRKDKKRKKVKKQQQKKQ